MYWHHVCMLSYILFSSAVFFFKSIMASDDLTWIFIGSLDELFKDSNSPIAADDTANT